MPDNLFYFVVFLNVSRTGSQVRGETSGAESGNRKYLNGRDRLPQDMGDAADRRLFNPRSDVEISLPAGMR